MSRPFLLLAPTLTIATLLLAACGKDDAKPAAASAPVEVGVVTLQAQPLAITTELPGRTTARMVAEIRPQVGGIVQQRLFEEGALVKAGQPLYQIEPASLRATLASAEAGVRKAESTLAAARTLARRNAELVKIDAISQQLNDESVAALRQAEADVGVASAAQDTARINLGFTRIVAPIAGRVGLSTVTPGALVTAGQATALTQVHQLDPIHVDVTQSSAELLRLRSDLDSGRLARSGDNAARIQLLLEDGSRYAHEGRLTFSGVTVDPGTGAVTLRAVLPNPQGILMPGMYVRAVLEQGVDDKALLVPQRAVTRTPRGDATALVVDGESKVVRRTVVLDRAVGNQWQVVEGLVPGERVVVEGAQRVKVGDVVRAVAVGRPDTPIAASAEAKVATAGAAPASAVRR